MNWALELADNPNTYTPLGPDNERIVTDRWVLWLGRLPGWNVAQRFRFRAEELDDVRAEIHAALRERGRSELSWEVGSHAAPADLVERLEALGLRVTEHQVGMVLDRAPDDLPGGVEVRRVETDEEWYEAERIAVIAFGEKTMPERAPYEPDPAKPIYLAYVDGVPVARGSASYSEHGVTLFGGPPCPQRAAAAPTARSSPRGGKTPSRAARRSSSRRRAHSPIRFSPGSASASCAGSPRSKTGSRPSRRTRRGPRVPPPRCRGTGSRRR
jgi:hypothetical protein